MNTLARAPVHPRVCGEHYSFVIIYNCKAGSSPRMRGTLREVPLGRAEERFIPAYAGNTEVENVEIGKVTVHPRVCGEHAPDSSSRVLQFGSSPRMRGTLQRQPAAAACCRFIPAYAGNTIISEGQSNAGTVHPRVCGEHVHAVANAVVADGSSPRMRGTLVRSTPSSEIYRFIPAYAGNTGIGW